MIAPKKFTALRLKSLSLLLEGENFQKEKSEVREENKNKLNSNSEKALLLALLESYVSHLIAVRGRLSLTNSIHRLWVLGYGMLSIHVPCLFKQGVMIQASSPEQRWII